MGKSYKKTEKIKLNLKKPWELPRGHQDHDQGCGKHDNRPRRERTRRYQLRKALDNE
jgi:hypothetical protein